MDFKLLVLNAAFFLGVPLLIIAGLVFKPLKKFLMALMCFALCYPQQLSVNLLSRESYRAATRGFELGVIDICAVSIFFIMLLQPKPGQRFRWFPPLTVPFAIYVFIGIIGWVLAPGKVPVPGETLAVYADAGYQFYDYFETGLYPLFELSKMLRGAFIYLVVVNFIRDEDDLRVVIGALMVLALTLTFYSLYDRYVIGVNRVRATLGHANSLGTFMGMMGTLMFGITIFSRTMISSGLYALATGGSLICVLLTISRGALAGLVLGLWIDVSALFHRYLNLKNFTILLAGSLVLLGMIFIAADTLTARFLGQQDAVADIEYRGLYNEEAKMMASEYPFGVGLGNFSTYSWTKYASKVGLNSPGTPAHNLWYLTLGETGYIGLAAFILYWLRFYSIGMPFLFRQRSSLIYAAAAAATAATLVGHIQHMLQLSYRQTSIYIFNRILMAVVVACWYIDRDTRRAERDARRLARASGIRR